MLAFLGDRAFQALDGCIALVGSRRRGMLAVGRRVWMAGAVVVAHGTLWSAAWTQRSGGEPRPR
jgi:hypothetical protein